MLIIPAIDLQDGCVVRLVQGRFNKKVYSREPVKVAKHWVKQGAKFLHLVDLDGAVSGTLKNLVPVKEILANVDVPVELGGGVRDIATIKMLLKAGVERAILGTKAVEDKKFLKIAFEEFGERVIVSIDARKNKISVKGWEADSKQANLLDFACLLKSIGFQQAIFTDILKDGTLSGPNIKTMKELLKKSGLRIIASGGVSCLGDLRKLKTLSKQGLSGVIIGKALYESRFSLKDALRLV
ncbi:MAG: 1-(5-phosphoribosyl)-5-[(5-phosphoribosylamino)methylideneamino]imidazole-4-carboxamide isomerase [Candidatus Omnitrophota bacterium]